MKAKHAFIWLIVIVAFFAIKSVFTKDTDAENKNNEPTVSEQQNNTNNNNNENNDNNNDDNEVDDEVTGNDEKLTEINDSYAFAEFTIDIIESVEKDGKTTVYFKWINQAGDGKKRFMGLALLTATQNGEELKDVEDKWKSDSNASPFYIENAQNGALLFDLTYDTVDPFEISIRGLADGQKEVIKIN